MIDEAVDIHGPCSGCKAPETNPKTGAMTRTTESMFGGYVKTCCLLCGCVIESHREDPAKQWEEA